MAQSREFRPSSSSPSAPRNLNDGTAIETADQLRIAIDRGRGGDKVGSVDPAAAPLGTDDEAAGTPPSHAIVRMAAEQEIHSRPSEPKPGKAGLGHAWWLVIVSGALGAGIAVIPYFLR